MNAAPSSDYKLCPNCGGDGIVIRASALRHMRKQARRGLRETALKMGISAPYLCDLELGRSEWSSGLVEKFRKAIKV